MNIEDKGIRRKRIGKEVYKLSFIFGGLALIFSLYLGFALWASRDCTGDCSGMGIALLLLMPSAFSALTLLPLGVIIRWLVRNRW